MVTKVKNYMKKYHMVNSGDDVIVGLSGGVDSVCLLFLLKKISGEMDFSLKTVHINHQLREESAKEALFVKKLCKKWGIPCEVISVDVAGYAKENHLGVEEAARILRYEAFEKSAEQIVKENGERPAEDTSAKSVRIALAHHQSDQAETVLFQLFRGSGIRGLTGIQPVRDAYIRPLLCISREEIEAFAKENGLAYVTDESNFDTVYARNKIRHEILPRAEEISGGAVEHIAKEAEMTADAMDLLDQITEETYKQLVMERGDGKSESKACFIQKESLQKLHPYLKSAVVYEMIARTCGRKKDISKVHVDNVLGLLDGQSGRSVDLIYGLQVTVQQKEIVIRRNADLQEKTEICYPEKKLNLSGEISVEVFAGGSTKTDGKNVHNIRCKVFFREKSQIIPCKPYTKWFDYDKIIYCPVVRNRRSGDYFYCSDTAKKKLQDYFVNEKIPLLERDNILLVADGAHIMWIVGGRISNYYKVTDETKRVLEITIFGGENNE